MTPAASNRRLGLTQPETSDDPLAAPRVTLMGNVVPIPEPAIAEARKLYLARHGDSKYWVDFEDFSFYRMNLVDLYYVGGFGVMGWVSALEYDSSQPDPLADTMARNHPAHEHRAPGCTRAACSAVCSH